MTTEEMRWLLDAASNDKIIGSPSQFTVDTLVFTRIHAREARDMVSFRISGKLWAHISLYAPQSSATLTEPASVYDEDIDLELIMSGDISLVRGEGNVLYVTGEIVGDLPSGMEIAFEIDIEHTSPMEILRLIPTYAIEKFSTEIEENARHYLT